MIWFCVGIDIRLLFLPPIINSLTTLGYCTGSKQNQNPCDGSRFKDSCPEFLFAQYF